MRGFHHAKILSPSFHGLRKERLAQWPAFCVPKVLERVCGTLLETLTLFRTKICDFPYPISDLIKNLISYFRPEALEHMTSCYGTYTVVGVNIKREMVLFPNDEEVANSSKKINPIQDECTNHTLVEIDTLFRTKTAKKIPFGAAHAYIAYIRDYPPRRKCVGDYESSCLRKRDK